MTGALTGGRVASTSWLEVTTSVSTAGIAGLAFDVYAPDDLKVAVLDVVGQRVLLGHVTPRGGWVVDAVVPWVLVSGRAYSLVLTLKGASASLQVDGLFAVSTGYNAGVVDGLVGMLARGSTGTFSSARLRTDDPAYATSSTPTGPLRRAAPPRRRRRSPRCPSGSASVTEGRSGQSTLDHRGHAVAGVDRQVTVVPEPGGGTATSGTDYVAWNPAGAPSPSLPARRCATVTILVIGDRTLRPTRRSPWSSRSSSAPRSATAIGVGTILDDDSRLTATATGPGGRRTTDLAAVAVRRWPGAATGPGPRGSPPEPTPRLLAGVRVVVEAMGGTDLAQAVGRTIRLDADAAGWGWSGLGGSMDLLSVLVHELGHVLGLEHTEPRHDERDPGARVTHPRGGPARDERPTTGCRCHRFGPDPHQRLGPGHPCGCRCDPLERGLDGQPAASPACWVSRLRWQRLVAAHTVCCARTDRPSTQATDRDRHPASGIGGRWFRRLPLAALLLLLLAGLAMTRAARPRPFPRSGWPGDRVAV